MNVLSRHLVVGFLAISFSANSTLASAPTCKDLFITPEREQVQTPEIAVKQIESEARAARTQHLLNEAGALDGILGTLESLFLRAEKEVQELEIQGVPLPHRLAVRLATLTALKDAVFAGNVKFAIQTISKNWLRVEKHYFLYEQRRNEAANIQNDLSTGIIDDTPQVQARLDFLRKKIGFHREQGSKYFEDYFLARQWLEASVKAGRIQDIDTGAQNRVEPVAAPRARAMLESVESLSDAPATSDPTQPVQSAQEVLRQAGLYGLSDSVARELSREATKMGVADPGFEGRRPLLEDMDRFFTKDQEIADTLQKRRMTNNRRDTLERLTFGALRNLLTTATDKLPAPLRKNLLFLVGLKYDSLVWRNQLSYLMALLTNKKVQKLMAENGAPEDGGRKKNQDIEIVIGIIERMNISAGNNGLFYETLARTVELKKVWSEVVLYVQQKEGEAREVQNKALGKDSKAPTPWTALNRNLQKAMVDAAKLKSSISVSQQPSVVTEIGRVTTALFIHYNLWPWLIHWSSTYTSLW